MNLIKAFLLILALPFKRKEKAPKGKDGYNVFDFIPIKKPHNNHTFVPHPDMENVGNLSVTINGETILSNWRVKSLRERLKFLLTGEISLIIYSRTLPPISLHVGDFIERAQVY